CVFTLLLSGHSSTSSFSTSTATIVLYALSLHDALPIFTAGGLLFVAGTDDNRFRALDAATGRQLWVTQLDHRGNANPITYQGTKDRKSTRLNSSHSQTSYAVFCLKQKKHDRAAAPQGAP